MEKRIKEINGSTYQLLLPSPRKAMPLCTRTAALIGPLLFSLGKKVAGADAKGEALTVFANALVSIDPDKLDRLFMDAVDASHLCCEGQPISATIEFEKHFDTHRSDVYQVCCWVLWECVKDFFPASEIFGQLMKKAQEDFRFQTDGKQTTGSAAPAGPGFAPTPT